VQPTRRTRKTAGAGGLASNEQDVPDPAAEVLMRAVVLRQFGHPDQLQVEDVAQPRPSEGEVLVKVLAAAINPSDVKNVEGSMARTSLPRIPGRDFAGIVVNGPPDWIGREVWGTGGDVGFTRDGSHAQYMLVPAAALISKPEKLTMEAAGAAGLTLVTAWAALVTGAAIRREDTVLILGAAGGVGSAALQIARIFGATVIAAVRNREQADAARDLGAAKTIDTSAASWVDEVRAQTDGRGADVVFDTTGYLFAESVEAVAASGRVCVISSPADGMVSFNLRSVYRKELRVLGTDSRRLDVTDCAKLLAGLVPAIEAGQLRPGSPTCFPIAQAREAYVQVLQGQGRICLAPNA